MDKCALGLVLLVFVPVRILCSGLRERVSVRGKLNVRAEGLDTIPGEPGEDMDPARRWNGMGTGAWTAGPGDEVRRGPDPEAAPMPAPVGSKEELRRGDEIESRLRPLDWRKASAYSSGIRDDARREARRDRSSSKACSSSNVKSLGTAKSAARSNSSRLRPTHHGSVNGDW